MPSVTVELLDTPPSANENRVRSHRMGKHRHKKAWQNKIALAFLAAGVRRSIDLGTVQLDATLTFATARGRDRGNYAEVLDKAAADALVQIGAIRDDTPEHYLFVGPRFRVDPTLRGALGRTTLTLTWSDDHPAV